MDYDVIRVLDAALPHPDEAYVVGRDRHGAYSVSLLKDGTVRAHGHGATACEAADAALRRYAPDG